MTLTKQKLDELELAVKPLMDWIEKDKLLYPHGYAVLEEGNAALLEGIGTVLNKGLEQVFDPPPLRGLETEHEEADVPVSAPNINAILLYELCTIISRARNRVEDSPETPWIIELLMTDLEYSRWKEIIRTGIRAI